VLLRRVTRLLAPAVCVALSFATPIRSAAALGDDDITPDSANSARFGVEQEGKQLVDSGAYEQAAELYWLEGVRLKDPVLILDSAEALRAQAAAERSIPAAQSAIERVAPALDMLYFLRDGATSSAWQPIAPEYLDTVITRAETLITDAEALIAEVEEEQRKAAEAAAAPVEPTEERRGPAKPGTGLIAGGSAALVIGLAGAGLGAAGLGLGAQAQSSVEDPLVYEPEHSAAEAKGQTANVLAGVGFALAGVGVGVGVGLIVVGVKKRKQSGGDAAAESEVAVVPVWLGDGGGLGLVGRF
jgi:hypothetical protein